MFVLVDNKIIAMTTFIVVPESKLTCDQMREEFWNLSLLAPLVNDVYDCIVWAALRNLIKNSVFCNMCNISKTFVKRTNCINQYMWKCKGCSKSTSIRDGSFFAQSHLTISQIIIVIYGFANEFSQKLICREAMLCSRSSTVNVWLNLCRKVCTKYFEQHPVELGGFNEDGESRTVELNEFHYRKVQWVFGEVERKTGKLFLTPVQARNEETLLPIISRTILPGTVIVTDGWEAYRNIGLLGGGVYEHRTVLQNYFVDPHDKSIHKQTIESVWMRVKKMLNRQYRTSTDLHLLPQYLQEFMWRERMKKKDQFVEFLICVSEQFLV
ncbi:unnamed protein product [Diabrotica balteata]|uniref:ISXO2-like transposase domain-containing protein n=1 Tax=Diabrotica balteata TaxID=107213 RepID=A0A9P0GUT4_DIABA|nr:unnamed protein product [Diabrotica balteata]